MSPNLTTELVKDTSGLSKNLDDLLTLTLANLIQSLLGSAISSLTPSLFIAVVGSWYLKMFVREEYVKINDAEYHPINRLFHSL